MNNGEKGTRQNLICNEQKELQVEKPRQAGEVSRAKLVKLNKAECEVLHLGQGNHHYQSGLGAEEVESSHAEKDLD